MAARSEVGARTVERPAEASRPTAAHEAEGARMGRVGCGDVDVFMDAWPKSGVMAAGRVYTVPESWLKVPEPAAGSVLATPKASDGAKGGPGQAYGTGDAPLPAQAAGIPADGFLYTPKQSDGVFAAPATSGRPLDRSTFLSTQVRLMDLPGRMDPEKVREHDSKLPTPRANDANGAGVHGDGAPDLRTAAVMLPTPEAGRAIGSRGSGQPALTSLFHTPRAGDWKPNPTGRGAHAEKTGSLPEQVAYELLRGSMRLTRIADRIGENGGEDHHGDGREQPQPQGAGPASGRARRVPAVRRLGRAVRPVRR